MSRGLTLRSRFGTRLLGQRLACRSPGDARGDRLLTDTALVTLFFELFGALDDSAKLVLEAAGCALAIERRHQIVVVRANGAAVCAE